MTRDHLLPVIRPGVTSALALFVQPVFGGAPTLRRALVKVRKRRWTFAAGGAPVADQEPLPDAMLFIGGRVESRGDFWPDLATFARAHGVELEEAAQC